MGCAESRVDTDLYTRSLLGSEKPGESPIYRTSYLTSIVSKPPGHEEIDNLQKLYLHSFKTYSSQKFLGTRVKKSDGTLGHYTWKTYGEVHAICNKIGSALLNLNLAPPIKGEEYQDYYRFIAIYAKNREQWVEVDMAGGLYGFTVVPLYDTLGPEAMDHIFKQTELTTVFTSAENIEKLLKGVESGSYKTLTHIISFDPLPDNTLINRAATRNIKIFGWEEFLAQGEKTRDYPELTPDTIFTFNYTSGTTALPKGVVLSHGNVLSAAAAGVTIRIRELQEAGPGDIYVSYLPLAHVLERAFVQIMITKGVAIGFFGGDIMKLKDDLQELHPTIMCAVPRMLNRFHDLIKKGLDELQGMKKSLAEKALATKKENLLTRNSYTHGIYDRLIFKKMRDALGGHMKLILCGGAPLSPEIGEFLKLVFCCPIVEGYGLTETCACSTMQRPEDGKSGNVGGPVPNVEIKIVDVPEMNYTTKDKDENGNLVPRGEFCIRGPPVFKGYYKMPQETAEVLEKDGWFHTGDIVRLNLDGSFTIIDRKKNIFKLAQGEYIAPEKIENIYVTSKYLNEAFVYGDSQKGHLVGIMVPDKDNIMALAQQLGVSGTFEELCKEKKIVDFILAELVKIGKERGLFSFEQVKVIALEPVSFMQLDLCTPSLKLKRAPAREHYKKLLAELYANS
jgi:Long-chain acyl-CoA synthetases (AMP-forming)